LNRILIVEDDPAVVIGLSDFVRSLGYESVVARDGERALALFDETHPDLILLDLVLPKRSGMDVCREIRGRSDPTPIIMVTAKGQPKDRVAGLDLGADDYVTKPFDLPELAARIRAVMRRAPSAEHVAGGTYDLEGVHIDLGAFTIECEGETSSVCSRERDILALLLTHRGQVVTRNQILDEVWGRDNYPTTRTVDNYIVSLRKKLESDPSSPRILLSVRGVGYKIVGPDDENS